jgi:type IV pilus assembly protein PilA
MIEKIARKMRDEDSGFTLIELMVVVLIIGILVAIALPTFLGARKRAQDKAAESNLRNGLVAAKTYFTDNDYYAGANGTFNASAGSTIEPSLSWVDGGAAAINEVHVKGVNATQVVLTTLSASGTPFCIADDSTAGTHFGKVDAADYASCTGGW